ncbi:MAG: hypothetical protein V3U98_12130, partial [Acidobacteriota bacterium]
MQSERWPRPLPHLEKSLHVPQNHEGTEYSRGPHSVLALWGAVVLGVSVLASAAPGAPQRHRTSYEGQIEIRLEPVERYYYPEQPVEIKVTFRNPTPQFMTLSKSLFDPLLLRAVG